MFVLPALVFATESRPHRPLYEDPCRIPDRENHKEFWKGIYQILFTTKLHSPVVRALHNYINPLFGYFGFRVHPVTRAPKYFHVGVSLDLKAGRNIYPVREGILEYSGYGATNGHYVLLSHPDIQTEDGYVLHSMYCHLKKPLVKFNSYQKMLREISLGSYPELEISRGTVLGKASTTGLSRQNRPGLYLQLSFRKYGEQVIMIDPLLAYGKEPQINQTASMIDPEEIQKLFL